MLTYDRRGISRSPAAESVEIDVHADDAFRLIGDLGPAYVFGTSLGALIGLDLATRHPESVRMLIAHEPPLPQFLPEARRADAIRAQERIEQVFRDKGLDAAMRALVASTGIHVADREPDAVLPRPSAQRTRNLEHMLTVDTPAARRFRLDIDALSAGGVRIEIGGGMSSGRGFPFRCGVAMADALDMPLVDFPGGHNGYITHPKAFAQCLRLSLD